VRHQSPKSLLRAGDAGCAWSWRLGGLFCWSFLDQGGDPALFVPHRWPHDFGGGCENEADVEFSRNGFRRRAGGTFRPAQTREQFLEGGPDRSAGQRAGQRGRGLGEGSPSLRLAR